MPSRQGRLFVQNLKLTMDHTTKSKPGRDRFHHGDLRTHSLRIAREHIEAQDVASLSLRSVAAEAGVNHRALYRHFADRDALIWGVAALGFEELLQACAKSLESSEKDDPLHTLLLAYARYAFEHHRLYKLMFSLPLNREFHSDSEIGQYMRALVTLAQTHIEARGRSTKELRDEIVRAWGQVHGLIDLFRAGVLGSTSNTKALLYLAASLRGSNAKND